MPKRFTYKIGRHHVGRRLYQAYTFKCTLKSSQCSHIMTNRRRCTKRTVIGNDDANNAGITHPFCWQHLLQNKKVRYKATPNDYGIEDLRGVKGLFAFHRQVRGARPGPVVRNGRGVVVF